MRKYNAKELKESFIQKARKVHGKKYCYSRVEYVNSQTKVCIICPIHGEFQQRPSDHAHGHGCPLCSRESRVKNISKYSQLRNQKCKENFIDKAITVHGNKYDYSKTVYTNSKEKVTITCPIHGDFRQGVANHLQGCGCPKCASEGISKGENTLIDILDKYQIPYTYQKIINVQSWPQKIIIDFYIEFRDKLFFIEYNGIQHYRPIEYFGGVKYFQIQCERDKMLREHCAKNGITLLEIKYDLSKAEIEKLILNIINP